MSRKGTESERKSACDHINMPQKLFKTSAGSTLSISLACRVRYPPYQNHDGYEYVELQNTGHGIERDLGISTGLQSDQIDDGSICYIGWFVAPFVKLQALPAIRVVRLIFGNHIG